MLGRVSAQNGSYQQLSIFMEVLNRIQNDYVDEPTIKYAVAGAIRGLVESVDPYGGYLSPKEVAFYKDYNPQKTPGIGVVLFKSPRLGYPVIVDAIPSGPAANAGLGTGDMIESIDGATTREMNQVQVNALLANPAGKPVALSVIRRRRAEPETVMLNREVVQAPPVEAKILDNTIAYLKVPFSGSLPWKTVLACSYRWRNTIRRLVRKFRQQSRRTPVSSLLLKSNKLKTRWSTRMRTTRRKCSRQRRINRRLVRKMIVS